jgi:hypothetical protein
MLAQTPKAFSAVTDYLAKKKAPVAKPGLPVTDLAQLEVNPRERESETAV